METKNTFTFENDFWYNPSVSTDKQLAPLPKLIIIPM